MDLETREWLRDDADEIVTLRLDDLEIIYSGICPHFGGPLRYEPQNNEFRCPWHDWRFDRHGRCVNRKVSCQVKIYSAKEL